MLAALVLPAACAAEEPRPNVLLITIDTLRADALGEDTPALLGLARRGTRFTAARAPAPLTVPSHATLLTGFAPPRHGMRDNACAPLPPRAERGFPTLAEEFADAGYATAAFVASNVLDARLGLDAGFARYDRPAPPARGAVAFSEIDAEEQVRRFARWLAARPGDRPFFAWVHLWDPHAPYAPWEGDGRRAGTSAGDGERARYRGEVRRADAAVEAMLALVPGETVVVVTSDHGESLGEHGEAAHGILCYGATMDVPLVLAGPGVPEAAADGRDCSLEDVAPTLRALAGLPEQAGDGGDLLGAAAPRVVVGESLYAWKRYGWAQQACARSGGFSLVDRGPALEMFDLRADPGETRPLQGAAERSEFEALDRALLRYKERAAHAGAEGGAGAPETPYGSLVRPESEFLAPARNRELPDPAARFEDVARIDRLRQAIALARKDVVAAALRPVLEIVASDPGNATAALEAGRAYLLVLERPHEAAAALEEAWRRGFTTRDLLLLRARALEAAGDADGAARLIETAGPEPR